MSYRYSIVSVDRAGCASNLWTTNSPQEALILCGMERERWRAKGWTGVVHILDDETGESVEDLLEDQVNG